MAQNDTPASDGATHTVERLGVPAPAGGLPLRQPRREGMVARVHGPAQALRARKEGGTAAGASRHPRRWDEPGRVHQPPAPHNRRTGTRCCTPFGAWSFHCGSEGEARKSHQRTFQPGGACGSIRAAVTCAIPPLTQSRRPGTGIVLRTRRHEPRSRDLLHTFHCDRASRSPLPRVCLPDRFGQQQYVVLASSRKGQRGPLRD